MWPLRRRYGATALTAVILLPVAAWAPWALAQPPASTRPTAVAGLRFAPSPLPRSADASVSTWPDHPTKQQVRVREDGLHCEIAADPEQEGDHYGGVRLVIEPLDALRLTLTFHNGEKIRTVYVDGYDADGRRQARWTWPLSGCFRLPVRSLGYVLRPGGPSGYFRCAPGSDLRHVREIQVVARVVGGSDAGFALHRVETGVASAGERRPGARAAFLQLCGRACEELKDPTVTSFFIHAYMVRALAVAYDLTGDHKYLDACRGWCDRMIAYQQQMTPKGAYYMGYHRRPGDTEGQWFVADSASIGMGVLATAARCNRVSDRARYVESVTRFFECVHGRYVRPCGGVVNGDWNGSSEPWWLSTALFGSMVFLLQDQTDDARQREVALKALDWLLAFDFRKDAFSPSFDESAPAVLMYLLEGVTAALPHLDPGSERYERARARLAEGVRWMMENQDPSGGWDLPRHWHNLKYAGLPFHMLVYARYSADCGEVEAAAERALAYLTDAVVANEGELCQELAFSLMSFGEKVSPGGIHRGGTPRASDRPR